MAAADTENWDEDIDFQGDLFTHSVSTVHTNFSSRLSMHSESNAGDEDWHVLLSPDDETSTSKAIQSAKLAGIPIPQNVPSSALMGGTIKRLGKPNSRPKPSKNNDDWAEDLDIPQTAGALSLKKPTAAAAAAAAATFTPKPATTPITNINNNTNDDDDNDDWANDLDLAQPGPLSLRKPITTPTPAFGSMHIDNDDDGDNDDWANDLNLPRAGGLSLKKHDPIPAFRATTIEDDDDWASDLNMPKNGALFLKKPAPAPTSFDDEERDDFDNFTDGSLGIRFAGTRRETRNRSSSASAMSPSLGSVTVESEEDDFRGLELPEGPVDLGALLKKRQAAEAVASPVSDALADWKLAQPTAKKSTRPAVLSDDNDDFLHGLDIGPGELLDSKKLTLNRNIKHKHSKSSIPAPARTPMTTLTFSDKPASTRIPRPVTGGSGSKPAPSRLEPVFESGATHVTRQRQQPSASSGATFLRAKRSMPVLRGPYHQNNIKPHVPFLPAGANPQSHNVTSKPPSHASAYHLRRDSDPHHRSQSPPLRPYSRLSSAYVPDTPSRNARRADQAPSALAKEAAAKRTVTKPTKKRNFGDGTELDLFDDLPTSTIKESKFLKQPSSRTAPKSLRNIPSRIDTAHGPTKIPLPDRMQTPAPPQTPRSPAKLFQDQSNTPRYLRDTAASRIARETRLRNAPNLNPRPRSEAGPLMPVTTNWKAQIAARSPHTSPSAARVKGKRATPTFIAPNAAQVGKSMTEKGMVFNPTTLRWEGNENSLAPFDFPQPLQTPTPTSHAQATSYMTHSALPQQTPPSPPRPALITPLASDYSNQNIKVVGGMVFDPRRMCWLKLRPGEGGNSPSVTEDEEDPFAGLEDLKDGPSGGQSTTGNPQSKTGGGLASDEWLVGEEFDLGPEFIRRQRDEEAAWRRKCEPWFSVANAPRREGAAWRWAIRDIAGQML